MNYQINEHELLCILDSLEEAMHKLPKESVEWAMCFDSANDVRKIVGKQPAPYPDGES